MNCAQPRPQTTNPYFVDMPREAPRAKAFVLTFPNIARITQEEQFSKLTLGGSNI